MPIKTKSKTPGKLILSGEHAVVYGAPALCMAVDLPTYCEFTQSELTQDDPIIKIELTNFDETHQFNFQQWRDHAIQLESKYQVYTQGNLAIESVLTNPVDLIICTLFHFNQLHKIQLRNWHIKVYSHGHIGKGIGSSASVIVGLLHNLYTQRQVPINQSELLDLARIIECRQHGDSSGLDVATVFYGGLILFQKGKVLKQLNTIRFQGYLIDTGTPASSTGQAVNFVKQWAKKEMQGKEPKLHPIWQEFTQTTLQIEAAWEAQNYPALRQAIRKNQNLLEQLGIVPQAVQALIRAIHQNADCVAKICGAGSSSGNKGGMVLMMGCGSFRPQITYPNHPFSISQAGSECHFVRD